MGHSKLKTGGFILASAFLLLGAGVWAFLSQNQFGKLPSGEKLIRLKE